MISLSIEEGDLKMSIRSRMYFDDLQNGTTEDKLIAVGELILLAKKKKKGEK